MNFRQTIFLIAGIAVVITNARSQDTASKVKDTLPVIADLSTLFGLQNHQGINPKDGIKDGKMILREQIKQTVDFKKYEKRDSFNTVMSVYRIRKDTVHQDEIHLYGSSRIGILKPERNFKL